MNFVVAVDGPAGSGKGTITKRIERELGLVNLDTGATYRCVALQIIKLGIEVIKENEEKISKLIDNIEIKIENSDNKDVVYLNGEDVTKRIREIDVTRIVPIISSFENVRRKMILIQRDLADGKNVIVEGRDIGTVVFPDADLKIYLEADARVRAKRRYEENMELGIDSTYQDVLDAIIWRDRKDKERKFGALKKAKDAITVDTTNLNIDEVTDIIKVLIKRRVELKKEKDLDSKSFQKLASKALSDVLENRNNKGKDALEH